LFDSPQLLIGKNYEIDGPVVLPIIFDSGYGLLVRAVIVHAATRSCCDNGVTMPAKRKIVVRFNQWYNPVMAERFAREPDITLETVEREGPDEPVWEALGR